MIAFWLTLTAFREGEEKVFESIHRFCSGGKEIAVVVSTSTRQCLILFLVSK